MKLDELIEKINRTVDDLDDESKVLAGSEHVLFCIGQMVGMIKVKSWLQDLQAECKDE